MQMTSDLSLCRNCSKLAWNVGNIPLVQALCAGVENSLQEKFEKSKKIVTYEIRHEPQKIAYVEINHDGTVTVTNLRFLLPEDCPYHLEYTVKHGS